MVFAWKYWYARQAARKWALLQLKYRKSENEIAGVERSGNSAAASSKRSAPQEKA